MFLFFSHVSSCVIAAAPIGYYTEPSRVVVCCLLFNVTLLFASFVEVRAQPRKLFASHHN